MVKLKRQTSNNEHLNYEWKHNKTRPYTNGAFIGVDRDQLGISFRDSKIMG